jgi:hypothetical protein
MSNAFPDAIHEFFAFASSEIRGYISPSASVVPERGPRVPAFVRRSALMTFRRIFPYFMTILAKHSLPNKTNPALPQESNRLRWRQSPHNPPRFLAAP